jgi:hypothetical protein
MKIIIEREELVKLLEEITYNQTDGIAKTRIGLEKLLHDHPLKTDGVLGIEIDEWPDYAAKPTTGADRTLFQIMEILENHGYVEML